MNLRNLISLEAKVNNWLQDPKVVEVFETIKIKPCQPNEFMKIMRDFGDDPMLQMMVADVYKHKCFQQIIENGGDIKTYEKISWMTDSDNRLPLLIACYTENQTEKWLQRLVANWSSFDYMHESVDKLKTIFQSIDKKLIRDAFIHEKECFQITPFEYYEDLDDEITIYRGGDERYLESGVCWSLDRGVAHKFCGTDKFSRYCVENPTVIEKTVKKKDIFGLVLDRCELEVIYFE